MSIDALSWAWKQDVDTPVSMCVLLHLADSANDLDGLTYYSLSAIAKRCRCHRSTAIRQLQLLSDQGYITLVKKAVVGKAGNTYRVNYHLNDEARQALEKQRATESDQSLSATTQSDSEVVAQSDQSQSATSSTKKRGGSTEQPVVVAESDTNPNLLTQNKRPTRAQGKAVDKSESGIEGEPPPPKTIDERIDAIIQVFADDGYPDAVLSTGDARQRLTKWVRLGLGQKRLLWYLRAIRTADRGRRPSKPIQYLHPRIQAELLKANKVDDMELQARELREVKKGRKPEDHAALKQAVGQPVATAP